ncbi:MAG: hypothetical protein VXZ96_00120 [Myxococcota bacterium]|nr:hypothetical protein [Myxococcota bacterium]
MGRKIKLKKRKKLVKERPFDDSDTQIQIRPDFVVDYTREDPMKMAEADPILERIFTKEIQEDIDYKDEDDDIGVRTREKHLPTMPTDLAFMANTRDAQDPAVTRDVQMSIRYYNDAIRSNTESAKVFIIGLIRQLRVWIEVQEPDPSIEPDSSSLYWVRDTLIPSMKTEMTLLEKHFNPEIDLELFRRWRVEGEILDRELRHQIEKCELQAKQLRDDGHDPLNPDQPRDVPLPDNNVLTWVALNPEEAKEALDNPNQCQLLTQKIIDAFFEDAQLQRYLDYQDNLQTLAGFDGERKDALLKLNAQFKSKSPSELQAMAEEFARQDVSSSHKEAVSVLTDLAPVLREMIQMLMKTTGKSGTNIETHLRKSPQLLLDLLLP